MTMHLVRGMSTINSKKRRVNRKPGQAAALAKHDEWLRKNGVHPDQLKKERKCSGNSIPNYQSTCQSVETSDTVTAIQGKKAAKSDDVISTIGLCCFFSLDGCDCIRRLD